MDVLRWQIAKLCEPCCQVSTAIIGYSVSAGTALEDLLYILHPLVTRTYCISDELLSILKEWIVLSEISAM
jgi:hypothetical protein